MIQFVVIAYLVKALISVKQYLLLR